MFFSRSVVVSALMGFAAARMGSPLSMVLSESPMASSTLSAVGALSTGSGAAGAAEGMVTVHIVQVGGPNGSLTFVPNNVKAAPGDLVQFQFHPKNHSVAQSTFDNPCVPIQNIMPNKTDAFFSGFMPTNASAAATNQLLTYTVPVKDDKPVWFYCTQGQHCQAGMVGAINAPESGNKTVASFTALAATAPENLTPGSASGSGSSSNSSAGNLPISPSAGGGAAAGGAGGAGAAASSTVGSAPAEATANVASGITSQSFIGLGAVALAAFAML
ncbi:hypothetical protein J1614_006859 [Plenodomus biglobosus]|nr:hypothetical protein J1614_006859 [Plenodomus biglobosus]